MKKLLVFITTLLSVILLVSCGASPKNVTKKYCQALQDEKYDKAVTYTDLDKSSYKDAAALLEFFNIEIENFEVLDENLLNDSLAEVRVAMDFGSGTVDTSTQHLVKKEGTWKIKW
ncbi:MAG: DUF4878 domain-containing protein [Bacteroidales bacterium]|nr:DUF4878 domain-containing protein [Bacteroidales bacterium]